MYKSYQKNLYEDMKKKKKEKKTAGNGFVIIHNISLKNFPSSQ